MENLEIKQILEDIDEESFSKMIEWMDDLWGKEDGNTREEIEYFMRYSFNKDKLPRTYGLFLNGKIIGMYQLSYHDYDLRPDIYPWLCNVYIDEHYRGKGYARYMLNNAVNLAKEIIDFDEIFLYTKHINLYEKFGFEYISDIDMFRKNPRIQRLYRLKLK